MFKKQVIFLCGCSALLLGCTDLAAVRDFASESSLISSNKAALDDAPAESAAAVLAAKLNDSGRKGDAIDPSSRAFKDRQKVVAQSLIALSSYMEVLAKLSDKGLPSVSSDVSSIKKSLVGLRVVDQKESAAVTAAGALADILVDVVRRNDIRKLVQASAGPVQDITIFLGDQAKVTKDTYTDVGLYADEYWFHLIRRDSRDEKFCGVSNDAGVEKQAKARSVCKLLIALALHEKSMDKHAYDAQIAAASAAEKAFAKIGADNAQIAVAAKSNSLGSKELADFLKADEPDLLAAIHNLPTL